MFSSVRMLAYPPRAALYQRVGQQTYLPKSWLDAFYAYTPAAGAVAAPPFLGELAQYLYSDCTPLPPCSCLAITPRNKEEQSKVRRALHDPRLFDISVHISYPVYPLLRFEIRGLRRAHRNKTPYEHH